MNSTKLVIFVEGGVVQWVASDDVSLDVILIDKDEADEIGELVAVGYPVTPLSELDSTLAAAVKAYDK